MSVFVTGATGEIPISFQIHTSTRLEALLGYIGGVVLLRLLNHPSNFKITALVRSPDKAVKLATLGVTPVVGSLDDSELLKKLCSESDVVLSMVRAHSDIKLILIVHEILVFFQANADHLPSVQAMLSGLKTKFEATGTPPILIHTVRSILRRYFRVLTLSLVTPVRNW